MIATVPATGVRRSRLFRLLVALAWIGAGVALFVLLERISMRVQLNSDGASNALEGWEVLHGNLLLHGWVLTDVSFYAFEVPLYAIADSLVGLGAVDVHVVGALTYLIVAALAVVLARTGSRGLAAAARSAVVIAVLAAPLILADGVGRLLENPDHFGTSAFLLGSFLLIDKAAGRRFTAPLLCVILCAGQIDDSTVRYIAVPAVLGVCGYRAVAARRLRGYDMAVAEAAAGSVPLSLLARAVMRHSGSYLMIPPRTGIAPIGQWPHHAGQFVVAAIGLMGAPAQPRTALALAAAVFVFASVLAAAAGFIRAAWTWRTASRAEQLLCAAILVYLAAYVVSTYGASREFSGIVPCAAVLAARACVPGRIVSLRHGWVVFAAAALAAVLPLATAAARPAAETQREARLTAWLSAHQLRYGLGWYWDAATLTVLSDDQVQVRAVQSPGYRHPFGAAYWEEKPDWYRPSLHRATFIIVGQRRRVVPGCLARIEQTFGHPAAIYHIAGWVIVSYRQNLLTRVATIPRDIRGRPAIG